MREITIPLPYQKPPLTANQRLHWAAKSRTTKAVRQAAYFLVKAEKLAPQQQITFRIVYVPKDRRRRDPSNLMPTQKAALDGVVDAGVVVDDCPPYVRELMPEIAEPTGKGSGVFMVIGIAV